MVVFNLNICCSFLVFLGAVSQSVNPFWSAQIKDSELICAKNRAHRANFTK